MSNAKKKISQAKEKVAANTERGARANFVEELFNDFYDSKARIYRVNFVRGLFFGFGSVIGGTVVIAIVVAILSALVNIPGGIGELFRTIVEAMQEQPTI